MLGCSVVWMLVRLLGWVDACSFSEWLLGWLLGCSVEWMLERLLVWLHGGGEGWRGLLQFAAMASSEVNRRCFTLAVDWMVGWDGGRGVHQQS